MACHARGMGNSPAVATSAPFLPQIAFHVARLDCYPAYLYSTHNSFSISWSIIWISDGYLADPVRQMHDNRFVVGQLPEHRHVSMLIVRRVVGILADGAQVIADVEFDSPMPGVNTV